MRGSTSIAVAMLATGCVSSSTWQVIDAAEARVARPRGEHADHAPIGGDCAAIAERAALLAAGIDGPRERARAAIARARAEGALPAPEVGLEVWDFPIGDPSRADREGMYMVRVGQDLPPAAALDARARAQAEEASAMLAEQRERVREIHAEVHHACIERSAAATERAALQRASEWLDRALELATARRSATGEPLAEVARLELERARIARALEELDAELERATASVAAYVGDVALDPPTLLEDVAIDDPSLDALLDRALEARGEIAGLRARARAADARADAAIAEATIPTVMLRASYMQMPQARAGLGAMIAISLPWLWSGERDEAEAARADARAEREDIAWRERGLRIELARGIASLRAARRGWEAIREHVRPAAERTIEAALVGYATGATDATEWLEAWRTVREVEIDEARALSAVAHARATLDEIVGEPSVEAGGAR